MLKASKDEQGQLKYDVKQGRLQESDIEAWLHKVGCSLRKWDPSLLLSQADDYLPSGVALGRLRLLSVCVGTVWAILSDDRCARLCHRSFEHDDTPIEVMPFSRTVLAKIIEAFKLPPTYVASLHQETARTARYSAENGSAVRDQLGMFCRFNSRLRDYVANIYEVTY